MFDRAVERHTGTETQTTQFTNRIEANGRGRRGKHSAAALPERPAFRSPKLAAPKGAAN